MIQVHNDPGEADAIGISIILIGPLFYNFQSPPQMDPSSSFTSIASQDDPLQELTAELVYWPRALARSSSRRV